MERVLYPSEEFNSFKWGVNIEDATIQRWIDEGMKVMEQDKTKQVHDIRSGNTLVVIVRYKDGSMQVYVTKDYEVKSLY